MLFKVLEATRENPTKNDFVKTCESYLEKLKINMTFEELGKLSKWSVKKMVKEKTHEAGFNYLLKEKNKQNKISEIQYSDLEIQEYLLEGNRNTKMSKVIFKARAMCLDIKTQKSWKYKDDICVACGVKSETGDELLFCSSYKNGKYDKDIQSLCYKTFYEGPSSDMHLLANVVEKRLKQREQMMEGVT